MNKNDLVNNVAEQTKLTKADCQRVLDAAIDILRKNVKKGNPIRLVGFGTFLKSKRSARKGRNPQTGEEIRIKAHWVPKFRAGKEFKSLLS